MSPDGPEPYLHAVPDTSAESAGPQEELAAALENLNQITNETGIDLSHPATEEDGVYRRADGSRPSAQEIMRTSEAQDRLDDACRKISELPDSDEQQVA